jgi:predicted Zn-dependent peptidase
MAFQTLSTPGLGIHIYPTTKFKTITIGLNFQFPLTEETLTSLAIVPALLNRGTRDFPSIKLLQEQLDDLYGATVFADISKQGERHILQLKVDYPNPKYLPGQPDLTTSVLKLLGSFLDDFALNNPDWFKQEKENLKNRIEGLYNNKPAYALVKCLQLVCENEPYGLYVYGRLEDLKTLDAQQVQGVFKQLLATAPADIFVLGDVEPQTITEALIETLKLDNRTTTPLPQRFSSKTIAPKTVTEQQETTQSQWVMGLRTTVNLKHPLYPAMQVYNGILGGFAHSKLFMNVREKASLCYSIRSRYDPQMGLLFIQAGVDQDKLEQAQSLIREQLAAMVAGDISEQSFLQTKAMLKNTFKESLDSPGAIINLAYESVVTGENRTIENLLANIDKVTLDQVVEVAKLLQESVVFIVEGTLTEPTSDESQDEMEFENA